VLLFFPPLLRALRSAPFPYTTLFRSFLAWRRCGRQMIFRARSRMMLTNERLITATGHWRSQTAQVPLEYIVDARAKGSTVSVFVMGTRNPIVLRDVPYAKRFVRLIRSYTRAL